MLPWTREVIGMHWSMYGKINNYNYPMRIVIYALILYKLY